MVPSSEINLFILELKKFDVKSRTELSYHKMNLKIKILLSLSYVIFLMIVMFAVSACSDSFTDDRDGQSYDMVQIGNQIWMAENLNFAGAVDAGAINPKDGAANPNVNVSDGAAALASFCPDGDDRNCKKYGRLYTWEAAQRACPAGWHLPSTEEFHAMFVAAIAADVRGAAMAQAANITTVGGLLKSTSGWFKKGNGTDAVHFNALPAGYMSAAETTSNQSDDSGDQPEASGVKPAAGKFDGIGGYAYFWTSTTDADEPAFAHYLFLDFSSPAAEIKSFDKNSARSVRCVKN